MTTHASSKVRLVICPKCRQVLPELPDVILYKCGGCNTVLEAKIRRTETSQPETASQPKDSLAEIQQDNVSEEKEASLARSPNSDLSRPCNGESSSPKERTVSPDEYKDSSQELCMDQSVPNGLFTSPEFNTLGSDASPLEIGNLSSESSPAQNSRIYDFNSSSGEIIEVRRFLDGFPSSGELDYHNDVEEEDEKSHVNSYTSPDGNEGVDFKKTPKEDHCSPDKEDEKTNFSSGGAEHDKGTNHTYVSPKNDDKSENISVYENGGLCENVREAEGKFPPANVVSRENRNSVQSAKPCLEVGDGNEGYSNFKQRTSVNVMSPEDEHLNNYMRKVTRKFGSASSMDTFGSSPIAESISAPGIKLRHMTGSPTTRSYYAHDGSDSSYDGIDDQMLEQIPHLSQRKSEDRFKSNDHKVNKDTETSYWDPHASSGLQGKQFYAMEGRNQNEFTEAKRNGHISRKHMRLDEQRVASRLPLASRGLRAEIRPISSSNPHQNSLPPRPRLHAADKPESYLGPDRMELLRTVCELKDQLDRIQFSNTATNPRVPARFMEGNHKSYYHDHLAPERNMYGGMNHPGYHLGLDPRLAFSGEAAPYRHQINCSCLHCCPQDRRYSAQLPTQFSNYKNIPCPGPTCHGHCNISCSSSPKHYMSSELSVREHERNFDKHRENEIKRLYLKEKYSTGKKLLRPIAGGAPVVSCYHCTELLQLPTDFLLFKKRYHHLRCNACRKILKFSLLKRAHIVPYLPDGPAPPPTEADDSTNLGLVSHSNSSQQVESVLYSHEYGRSFDRSCSTEGDGSSTVLPSYDLVQRNGYKAKMSSGSSYEHMVEDKKQKSVLKEPKYKGPMERFDSAGPSSRVPKFKKGSSEIEELSTNSPLHRLMGYSSPSQVLKSGLS